MVRTTMAAAGPSIYVVDDVLFEQHRSPGHHPERPERLRAARRGLGRATPYGVQVVSLPPRDATTTDLLRVHFPSYVAKVDAMAGMVGALDVDTYISPGTAAAARRAAGGAIMLLEALLGGTPSSPRQGLALLRPPGHHASARTGMGYCIFNNVAVAARFALAQGVNRVAIVDFDAHHGNGTQDIFWSDDRVLFLSVHGMPLYPGSGHAAETGAGRGTGFTKNVPLPAGSTFSAYRQAFQVEVVPALLKFAPEILLVSAGFDAHERDPLGTMRLTERDFGWMCAQLRDVAEASAGGRMALVLEGGYDLPAIERSVLASVLGMVGVSPVIERAP